MKELVETEEFRAVVLGSKTFFGPDGSKTAGLEVSAAAAVVVAVGCACVRERESMCVCVCVHVCVTLLPFFW